MDQNLENAKRAWESEIEDIDSLLAYARLLLRTSPQEIFDKYGANEAFVDNVFALAAGRRGRIVPTHEIPLATAAFLAEPKSAHFLGKIEDPDLRVYYIVRMFDAFSDENIRNELAKALGIFPIKVKNNLDKVLFASTNLLDYTNNSDITHNLINNIGIIFRAQDIGISYRYSHAALDRLFRLYEESNDEKIKTETLRMLGEYAHYRGDSEYRQKIQDFLVQEMSQSEFLSVVEMARMQLLRQVLDGTFDTQQMSHILESVFIDKYNIDYIDKNYSGDERLARIRLFNEAHHIMDVLELADNIEEEFMEAGYVWY